MEVALMLKYNSLIQVMNYLTIETSPQSSSQRAFNSAAFYQINQTKTILGLLSLALSTDFSRYSDLLSAKIILQELINPRNLSENQIPRSQLHSQSAVRAKDPIQSVPKLNQKSQPTENNPALKRQAPKTISTLVSPAPHPPISSKINKKLESEKLASPKLKKKIYKIPEVKKENPGRVPRINMVQTAEISRSSFGEKERRKLKERLLIRQVKYWGSLEQFKRDRRELRILY